MTWLGKFQTIAEDFDFEHKHRRVPRGVKTVGTIHGGQFTKKYQQGEFEYTPGDKLRIPSRLPSQAPHSKAKEKDAEVNKLGINIGAMKSEESPELFKKNIDNLKNYNGFKGLLKDGDDDKTVASKFIRFCRDNLLWLYNQEPKEIRDRMKQWYQGANKICKRQAKIYDLPLQSVAGIYAALSPQNWWELNVAQGNRVLDTYFKHANKGWDEKMSDRAQQILAAEAKNETARGKLAEVMKKIEGTSLQELIDKGKGDDDLAFEKGLWIRVYDQTYGDKFIDNITPEGKAVPLTQAEIAFGGKNAKMSWMNTANIAKAIQCIESKGDMQKIALLMGDYHKVRSFYNNIVAPKSSFGDSTIDTHEVGACLLRNLSGETPEVLNAWGGARKGISRQGTVSGLTGIHGLYPLYLQAIQEAALEVGLLPCEIQAITWGAKQDLFGRGPSAKAKNSAIETIWSGLSNGIYKDKEGETALDQIRKDILASSGIPKEGKLGVESEYQLQPPKWSKAPK
jgi:hypothetical protein